MDANDNLNENERLEELGGSDFEIVDGHPDIRGWQVQDINGNYVGEADELIFDKTSRKVLYIVVDLDGNEIDLKSKKVLVPIGLATLHENEDEVILAELASLRLNNLPEYTKGNITPQMEATIHHTFTGLAAAIAAGETSYQSHPEDFYKHEHFEHGRFYGGRRLKD
ncbi:PRC-barrel domain-containing protein [Dyadobacter psychrotolerans]|uniref:PRC-barrel domain containing protein n=1 Tax=Dyadobacter psychrotolerans TaxID=2541721 RepID=A0A4V2Z479_9BACT|nr:PRC-barrel domain-containing protein [Dyadobacter psychrotolerans]TDE15578.1 PRC-barrel domain containing protein [Dyadobacter psychrotolerans]